MHRETADRHVLGHAPAQRADRPIAVSHGSAPVLSEVLKPPTSTQVTANPLHHRPPTPDATNYRESGLVLWPRTDLRAR